jgi:hypothetical protein
LHNAENLNAERICAMRIFPFPSLDIVSAGGSRTVWQAI